MPGSWIDERVWRAVIPDLVLNPDAALYRFWRQQRARGVYLGAPVTPEVETPVGMQQAFASGAVVVWSADGGARFAHDE